MMDVGIGYSSVLALLCSKLLQTDVTYVIQSMNNEIVNMASQSILLSIIKSLILNCNHCAIWSEAIYVELLYLPCHLFSAAAEKKTDVWF